VSWTGGEELIILAGRGIGSRARRKGTMSKVEVARVVELGEP
jgi:hypothetical protein